MYNNFLHKLAIIFIFNIDSEIMYSELLPSLQKGPRFKGIERTHSTDSDRKWIIITTKSSKEAAIVIIGSLIEKSSVPNSNPKTRPGRYAKYNINSTLVSCAAILQNSIESIDNTKKNPLLAFKNKTFKSPTTPLHLQTFYSRQKKSKPSPPNKNNESTSDQASELPTLDTNTDTFQSMIETNISRLKS